jgi:molybdate-binding protein/DNA-binding XRE family transcriptional regulator
MPEIDTIMASRNDLDNDVRAFRTRARWSQAELAQKTGLSRAGISAIEMGRLVPSTAAALALAAALGCPVESLFRLPQMDSSDRAETWAWHPTGSSCRYWRAEVAGRRLLYPVEVSSLGLIPHDGTFKGAVLHDHPRIDPAGTLVLACCDPAVGLLAAPLARSAGIRLIVLPRSSRIALELLKKGLVHAAGVHLARSDLPDGNATAVRQHLGGGPDQGFQLLRVADWDEGIALAPSLGLGTIRAIVRARLRWVDREPGSGARQCLDEVLGTRADRQPGSPWPQAHDHRGVADAIRAKWADAGICLRLTSEEANLSFMSVRTEAYEICFLDSLAHDPRLQALRQIVQSTEYRRSLGELPGYDTARAGELQRISGCRA